MSAKIRLLQVIPEMDVGGAETGALHVAEHVSKEGGFSAILTSGGKLLDLLDRKKIKIIRWPISKNIFFILINIFVIFFILLFLRINIVHVRSRGPAWSCYFASLFTKAKLVSTFHGTYNFKSNLKKFYNSIMLRCDHVIAGSNFILNHIHENYNVKTKTSVVKRGVDQDYFSPKNVTEDEKSKLKNFLKIPNNKFIVLLPGRLTYWKGQKLFVEALNILRGQNKVNSIFGLIIGDSKGKDKYREELLSLINKYQLTGNIILAHGIKKMPVAYAISNLVVSSSIEPEAFGRVSVEAQSMEVPVLASNIGGSLETVINNKTGWLFDSENPESLSKNLDLISNQDSKILEAIGKQGRKNVLQNYTRELMCSRTLEIYHSLV
jgi:glycosyltransferase involved in cell wall biosynthesis